MVYSPRFFTGCLLSMQLLRKWLMDLSLSLLVGVVPQAVVTVAVVIPTRKVDDRVEADTLNRDALAECGAYLCADVAEPVRACVPLGSGLSDKEGTPVPCKDFTEHVPKGAIFRVRAGKHRASLFGVKVNPLV